MGADWSASAFIGVRLDPKKLKKTTKVRGCEHELPPASVRAKCCPECGEPLWEEKTQFLNLRKLGLVLVTASGAIEQESDEDYYDEEDDDYDEYGPGDDEDCFVTHKDWHVETGSNRQSEMTGGIDLTRPSQELMNLLVDKLQPLGLWNRDEFKLWAVLHCSY